MPLQQNQNQPSLSLTNDPSIAFPQQQHQTIFSSMPNFSAIQSFQSSQNEPIEFGNVHSSIFQFQPNYSQQKKQSISQPNQETIGINFGHDTKKIIPQFINDKQKHNLVRNV